MSLLGSELITNSVFTYPDTDWTVTGGTLVLAANYLDTTDLTGTAYQTVNIVAGRSYVASFEILSMGGSVSVQVGGTSGAVISAPTTGVQTQTIVAGSSNSLFVITCDDCRVDNASLMEISVADKIEKTIFDILRINGTVSGLVSSRIYPNVIPQNTALPAIVYYQISGARQHTLASTDNMVPSRWQFTCVASTYAELRGLSDAVRGALDNYVGVVGTVTIQCAHFVDEIDQNDVMPGTDKLRRYSKAIDFYINYNE